MQPLTLIDCPRQPGSVRLSPSACGRMYLRAQHHPTVEAARKRGKQGIPNSLVGTSLGECLDCAEGCANAALLGEARAPRTGQRKRAKEREKMEVQHEEKNGTGKPLSRRVALTAQRLAEKRAKDRAGHNARTREKLAPYLARDGMKRCRACGEVKPVAEFLPHKITLDGYRIECEPCRLLRQEELRSGARPRNNATRGRSAAPRVNGGESQLVHTAGLELSIPFIEQDRALYQRLLELAQRERRSPEQQVLRILEERLSEGKEGR